MTRYRVLALVALGGFVCVLALLTFGPHPNETADAALLIRHSIDPGFDGSADQALYELGPRRVDATLNVFLFVPAGVLGAAVLGRRHRFTVPVCFLASLGIETGQLLFTARRDATPVDVVTNTIGAVIGYGLFLVVRAAVLGGVLSPERFRRSRRRPGTG